MRIGKFHSSLGDAIHLGSGNPGLPVVTTQIPLSHVVTQDDDNVWPLPGGRRLLQRRCMGEKQARCTQATGLQKVAAFQSHRFLPKVISLARVCDLLPIFRERFEVGQSAGRVAMAWRITPSTLSRSSPTTGRRGARVVSLPSPTSAIAILMYCTSLIFVSRCRSGVYQR